MTVGASATTRRAGPADATALTRVLVRAYMDDPVAKWIAGSEQLRARTLYGLYSARVPQMLVHGEVWTNAERTSAAVWLAPDMHKPAIRPNASLQRCLLDPRLALRLPLLALGLSRMEAAHPPGPAHWYLSLLGTDPACRGHGLGSAVLEPVLERCDIAGVGAYLESSSPRNLSLYARHGFHELQTLQLPAGPRMWLMWREPQRG